MASLNTVYKKFIDKTQVPFKDFLKAEQIRHEKSGGEIDFKEYVSQRYSDEGLNAWENDLTKEILKELGYDTEKYAAFNSQDLEVKVVSANGENIQGYADSASGLLNSIGGLINVFKKDTPQQPLPPTPQQPSPPTPQQPSPSNQDQPPSFSNNKKSTGLSTGAIIGLSISGVAVIGSIVLLSIKASR